MIQYNKPGFQNRPHNNQVMTYKSEKMPILLKNTLHELGMIRIFML